MIWVKRISLTILAILLFLVITIAVILYTPAGLKFASWGAQKALPALSIGDTSGSLLRGFQVDNVRYQDSNMNLAVKQLNLTLDDSCLLTPEICISDVGVNGVKFSMPTLPPATEPEQPSKPVTEISLPIPIKVDHVTLDNIDLDILSNKVNWQHFSTAATVIGSHVTLKPTDWDNIKLALAPAEKPVKSKAKPKVNVKAKSDATVITLPDVVLPMSFDIERFTVKNFELEGKTPQKVSLLEVIASGKGSEINLKKLQLDAPQANLNAKAQVTLAGDYPLTLNADANIAMKPVSGQTLTLKASGSLQKLVIDAQLKGKLDAIVKGKLSPLKADFPFDVAISSQHLQWPIDKPAEFTVDKTIIDAKGSLNGFTFNAKSNINGKPIPAVMFALNGKGDLNKVDLSSLKINTLGGVISGNAKASWKDLVNWSGQLQFADIQPGLQWPAAQGNVSGKLATSGGLTKQGGWFVKLPQLAVNGTIMKQALTLVGKLDASDANGKGDLLRVNTPGLTLKHGPNGMVVKGQLDKTWNMVANIDAPNLSKSLKGLHGAVNGNVMLSGSMATPDIKLDLQGNDLGWQQLASLASFDLKGNVTPLPDMKADVSLTAAKGKYGTTTLDDLKILFKGTEQQHSLSVNAKGEPVGANILINGDFNKKTGWKGTLVKGDISTPLGDWVLNHPTLIRYDLKTAMATVGAHCWQQGQAGICLTNDLSAGTSGQAQLAIRKFNFDLLKPFLPPELKVTGELGANVDAKWSPKTAPYLKANIIMPAGGFSQQISSDEQPLTLGWDKVTVNADMQDNVLNANWLVAIKNNGDLSGRAKITNLQGDKQINANVKLDRFTLGFLEPMIKDYHKFDGQVDTNLTVTGPILHPAINGLLQVSQLEATGRKVPLDIKNADIKLAFNGYNANLIGNIYTPDGQLLLRGTGDWQNMKAWKTKLNINGKELKVSVPPMVALKVSPDLTIEASPTMAEITGKIGIPWGRITVNQLPKSAVRVSKDQVILKDDMQPLKEKPEVPFDIKTNIFVHIGDDVKLSAFGLKASLLGDLNVRQAGKGPMIYGEVNIAKGSYYRALGQELLIRKGQILFNGPAEQPYLSIEAIRDPDNVENDVIAGVRVTGPADKPEVNIFSDPAMPQQNALSYILTGKNLDSENSDGSNSAMTTALIGMGLAQSGQLVGDVGEAVGVKDLSLSTSGAGDDSQVTISGYIAPGLQVKYGVGIFNQVDEFTLRYRLLQNLYVEAVSGLDQTVDLLYQFEFN
ncbi:translocation/assembly module TamB domain-containing protein [Photobacterium carnosum]|uniref:autotransporter assembly complex protein TamB n=1 Tax=Photobacterium carnosum TaxID=2023717 RepID=UPI001E492A3C|nr:translocation/assembly module TamB domain-containing protein [Photobacterium carnosum]MCD9530197.1 translocation/assembly module TamB [Photobacterium carnosum]MCF2154385.1 translocation/assembly module TamB [Photobacterium carnosum]MCF2216047.1 translocation/assembly module TamB [Photobacterium carnosum]